MTSRKSLLYVLFALLIFTGGDAFAQSFKSESELRKQAEKDFKSEDYATALPLYSQLLSLNQKDAKLNYRYGVCLLMADKDKTSSYNYLEFASRDAKMEDDVYFYIGKSLQLKYRFDEAVAAYREYIKRAGSSAAKKFDTERQIETCNNAKELLKSRIHTTVKSSKEVSKNVIYGAYDFVPVDQNKPGQTTGRGKLLATSYRFMTSIDTRKITNPIMFLTADGQTIYYASYGKKEDNGKDIYVIHKLPTGEWEAPQNLGAVVNTKYDEDYPYLDPDGKTLYFSSKGHNSMGGYDMFKTTLNASTGEWSEPENLGAGINSPDDDFFYMPLSDGEAQFASNKETAAGLVTIYNIEVASSQKALATIRGRYKSSDQPLRADGKISVLRKSDNGLVATSRTDQRTGEYELSVPAGDEYEIVVEGGGYMAHVEDFSLPSMDRPVTIAQQINMNRSKGIEQLEIRNQYVQNDSVSLASTSLPKGTEVIRNEYPAADMDKDKLQAFNINGQVVYATPPPSKTAETTNQSAVASVREKSSAATDSLAMNSSPANKEQDNRQATNSETQQQGTAPVAKEPQGQTTTAQTTTGTNSSEENKSADANEIKNEENRETAPGNGTGVAENRSNEVANPATPRPSHSNTSSSNKKADTNTANISDNEMVKIAFSDAEDLDAEAKEAAADAAVAHAVAIKHDSTSRVQLNQMVEVMKTGDEGAGRELSRQSQLNADSAQQERILASQLEEKAQVKQEEASKALADAKQLKKNVARNASGQVTKNDSRNEKKKETNQDENKNADVVIQHTTTEQGANSGTDQAADPQSSKQVSADNNQKSVESQKETEATKQNEEGEVKESVSPALSQAEQTTAPSSGQQQASSDSISVGENKSNASTPFPATSVEATKRADASTQQSKDFKLEADALKEQVKNSDDKQLNKQWTKEADEFTAKSKEKEKEAEKDLVIAKKLKKLEEKNPVQSADVAAVAPDQSKNASQQTTTSPVQPSNDDTNQNTTAVKNNPVSAEEPVVKSNSASPAPLQNSNSTPITDNGANQGKETATDPATTATSSTATTKLPAADETTNTSDTKLPVATTNGNAVSNENASVPPGTTIYDAQEASSTTAAAEDAKTAQAVNSVAPAAVTPYKEYLKTKQESDIQAKQADVLQTKIEKMPSSPERDQLVQQSNDLNMQSIKTWQQAQVKLNEAKQADPSVEAKLKDVHFAGINPVVKNSGVAMSNSSTGSSTTSSNSSVTNAQSSSGSVPNDRPLTEDELQTAKQKDSLISEAVKHRAIAEDTKDTATEKSELQTTKQLILDSKNPAVNESTNNAASNSTNGSQTGNTTATGQTNEDHKNVSSSASSQIAEQSSQATENKKLDVSAKNVTENAGSAAENISANNKSSKKEVADKSSVNEGASTATVAETGAAANAATPVLDAKTLHVDEAAVFSVSPKQIYSAANPVPMDPQLPEGLVFKVQIGAFHTPLSPEAFKNVQPLSGETTRAGWIRYCVGLFRTFEPANLVKMEMRATGYKDAFVVAYYNGKRISLFEAYSIINRSGTNEKRLYADASDKETQHLNSMEIKAGNYPPAADEDAASFYGTLTTKANADGSAVGLDGELSRTEYAVQVGVYKSSTVPKKLQSLIPLDAELYRTNLYRFTTGRFSERSGADSMRLVAVNAGVKDAFVIIYKGGTRGTATSVSATASKITVAPAPPASAVTSPTTQATPASSGEIIFKVQIGAYRADLSEAKLSALKSQSNADLSQSLTAGGLHLIYAGSFKDYNQALALKNDLAAKGMKDAFVVASSGDTKIAVDKARK